MLIYIIMASNDIEEQKQYRGMPEYAFTDGEKAEKFCSRLQKLYHNQVFWVKEMLVG